MPDQLEDVNLTGDSLDISIASNLALFKDFYSDLYCYEKLVNVIRVRATRDFEFTSVNRRRVRKHFDASFFAQFNMNSGSVHNFNVIVTYLFACDIMNASFNLAKGTFSNVLTDHIVANAPALTTWLLALIYWGRGSRATAIYT